jgi:acyl-CoA thioester hydrolase
LSISDRGRHQSAGRVATVAGVRLAFDPPLDPARYPFAHTMRVRFAETDAMGIVHHGAYLAYLEEARVEYLRAIEHPYDTVRLDGIDLAVLEAYVRYLRPLRFDDRFTVHLVLGSATRATFQMGYLLTLDGRPHATGVTVHGCVDHDGRPVRMPQWLAEMGEMAEMAGAAEEARR